MVGGLIEEWGSRSGSFSTLIIGSKIDGAGVGLDNDDVLALAGLIEPSTASTMAHFSSPPCLPTAVLANRFSARNPGVFAKNLCPITGYSLRFAVEG